MTIDVTYLFMYLLVSHIYIFTKGLLKSFTHFFIVLFVILLRYCLYILDTSSLQDVYFVNIFL